MGPTMPSASAGSNFLWRSFFEHLPIRENIRPITNRQRLSNIMIGHQNPDATFTQLQHNFLNVHNGQWINPKAFADPGNNIGRWGDASPGSVVGPGTKLLSLSLLKRIQISESSRFEMGAQISNVFNHPNYGPPPNMTVGIPSFAALTYMQSAEGAGPRAMQLVARARASDRTEARNAVRSSRALRPGATYNPPSRRALVRTSSTVPSGRSRS
jgi:hypothetical protein